MASVCVNLTPKVIPMIFWPRLNNYLFDTLGHNSAYTVYGVLDFLFSLLVLNDLVQIGHDELAQDASLRVLAK